MPGAEMVYFCNGSGFRAEMASERMERTRAMRNDMMVEVKKIRRAPREEARKQSWRGAS